MQSYKVEVSFISPSDNWRDILFVASIQKARQAARTLAMAARPYAGSPLCVFAILIEPRS